MNTNTKQLTISTGCIHGSYPLYLSHDHFDIDISLSNDRSNPEIEKKITFPIDENVGKLTVANTTEFSFESILLKHSQNFEQDQYQQACSEELPATKKFFGYRLVFSVTKNTSNVVADSKVGVVGSALLNQLRLDHRHFSTRTIDHSAPVPQVRYLSELEVVVKNILAHNERLGHDEFGEVRRPRVGDLSGPATEKPEGLDEILHRHLSGFIEHCRIFFNTVRYTSPSFAVIKAIIDELTARLALTKIVAVRKSSNPEILNTQFSRLSEMSKELLKGRSLTGQMDKTDKAIAFGRVDMEGFAIERSKHVQDVIQNRNIKRPLDIAGRRVEL